MRSKAYHKREYLALLGQAQKRAKRRKALIETADKSEILAITEIIDNLLRGNIPLTPEQRGKLSRHKQRLRDIASKRVSLKRKRAIIQQSGGFISALIPIAMSLIGGLGSLIGGSKRR